MKIDNRFITVLLVVAIVLVVLANLFLMKEGNECLDNPLIYGAEKYSKANSANFKCQCSLDVPNSPLVRFDSEGLEVEDPYRAIREDIDTSQFNFSISGDS